MADEITVLPQESTAGVEMAESVPPEQVREPVVMPIPVPAEVVPDLPIEPITGEVTIGEVTQALDPEPVQEPPKQKEIVASPEPIVEPTPQVAPVALPVVFLPPEPPKPEAVPIEPPKPLEPAPVEPPKPAPEPPKNTNGIPQKVLDLTPDELDAARRLWATQNIGAVQAKSAHDRTARRDKLLGEMTKYIKAHAPVTLSMVAYNLNISPRKASDYLRILVKSGKAKAQGETTSRRYS